MIASASSERGLSDVTTTSSASWEAMRPMTGRLALSRSPPQPKTTWTRPPPACASGRTVLRTPSRAAGLWA